MFPPFKQCVAYYRSGDEKKRCPGHQVRDSDYCQLHMPPDERRKRHSNYRYIPQDFMPRYEQALKEWKEENKKS